MTLQEILSIITLIVVFIDLGYTLYRRVKSKRSREKRDQYYEIHA